MLHVKIELRGRLPRCLRKVTFQIRGRVQKQERAINYTASRQPNSHAPSPRNVTTGLGSEGMMTKIYVV